ncbi:hypothetical protein GQ53DRAFT_454101 [Thozetella sp. PMI_491]|nr:hypothetical protein GQ53DRAFT_454101 [Thozetella sp. PMI_491]
MDFSVSPGVGSMRISQRQPTACKECTRRKVRCDKKVPCSRCVRLHKACAREVVRTSKSLSTHREELNFLHGLRDQLTSEVGASSLEDAVQDRISSLEHGQLSPVSERQDVRSSSQPISGFDNTGHTAEEVDRTTNLSVLRGATANAHRSLPSSAAPLAIQEKNQAENAANVWGVESLVWGRNRGACYPHRQQCHCRLYRSYAELASINCDMDDQSLIWVPVEVDPAVFPDEVTSRKMMAFHMKNIWWHHTTTHGPTFLKQCEIFWRSGTVIHPLWVALYLAITATTSWVLLNSDTHLKGLGLDLAEDIVERQYRAMLGVLYREQYLEHSSMFAIQAIAVSTRVAHSLGLSDLNAKLLSSSVGIAQSLGLHRIRACQTHSLSESTSEASRNTWYETIETEVGKRTWWQLVVQDYFGIPFTETFLINRAQFSTPIHVNCDDCDMVEREEAVPTLSSYVRIVAREAVLMPPLLEGLGSVLSRRPIGEIYHHVLRSDQELRKLMRQIPGYLARDNTYLHQHSWLPAARRTLAISAADKIIMIHRPVLFYAFQNPAYSQSRTTCIAAATTILREHEQATIEQTVSTWTQSAFCITAIMVLGLELLHRASHTDDQANQYRDMLAKAAERLRGRRSDTLATRGAKLVDSFLGLEEDLVIRVMRKRGGSLEEKKIQIVHDVISNNELLARFLDADLAKSTFASPLPVLDPSPFFEPNFGELDLDQGVEDFDIWFNEIFAPDYLLSTT